MQERKKKKYFDKRNRESISFNLIFTSSFFLVLGWTQGGGGGTKKATKRDQIAITIFFNNSLVIVHCIAREKSYRHKKSMTIVKCTTTTVNTKLNNSCVIK